MTQGSSMSAPENGHAGDGGPAFAYGDHEHGGHSGMSLRDWFAGQICAAVAGGLAAASISTSEEDASTLAKASYRFADALLAARSAS